VFLIVDRLRAYRTPAIQAWVAAHAERLEVFYLPRYAPELNPDEYLNNDRKSQVNKLVVGEVQGGRERKRKLRKTRDLVYSTFKSNLIHIALPTERGRTPTAGAGWGSRGERFPDR